MKRNILYYQKNSMIECIYYENATSSYPMHTHTNHITMGYVTKGAVCVTYHDKECVYQAGEHFCIMPDIPHAVKPANNITYSMISVCIFAGKMLDESEETGCLDKLKKMILDAPEDVFLLEDMAKRVGISPYHMIRRFKEVCGLTPHPFQIQCRIRKAQKLLEEGKSVTEVAYDTGFCDQSHFDRCFRKIVSMTPNEYKKSVIHFV